MTWTKFGDEYFEKTLLAGLSDSAVLTDLEAKGYCNRMLTDGRLPKALLVRAITRSKDPAADAAELVAAGYWHDLGHVYQIPWKDQRKREVVEAEQAANRERQERYRERQALHNSGDHSHCDPKHCWALKASNGVTENVTPAVDNAHPDPSVPTDPTVREEGRDRDMSGANAPRSADARSRDRASSELPIQLVTVAWDDEDDAAGDGS